MAKERSTLKVIWFFFKQYKIQIIILFALSLLIGSLEAAIVATVYPMLSAALGTGIGQNGILAAFVKVTNLLSIEDKFIAFSVVFMVIALLAFVVKLINVNFRTNFSAGLVKRIQGMVFHKFIKADYQYFIDHKQGDLIYKATIAPQRLSTLANAITDLFSQLV